MEQTTLQKCQELIDYRFNDLALLELALTHASVAPTRHKSNERMEFLGDAVLGMVVCNYLYEGHADLLEGEMTKIKSLVVSRRVCAFIADELGLSELLHLGKGMNTGEPLPRSVAAAVFEAIIGAIHVDGGLEPSQRFVLEHVRPRIDEALDDEHKRNYKSMLQQRAQRVHNTTPEYQLLDEKGPDHNKCFEIAVVLGSKHFQSAWGTTKKEAEQLAARVALEDLGLIKEEDSDA